MKTHVVSFLSAALNAKNGLAKISLSTLQTQRPQRIPAAILGTVIISGVVYMILSVSLSLIISPTTLGECANEFGDLLVPQPEDCVFPHNYAYALAFTVGFNGVRKLLALYLNEETCTSAYILPMQMLYQ